MVLWSYGKNIETPTSEKYTPKSNHIEQQSTISILHQKDSKNKQNKNIKSKGIHKHIDSNNRNIQLSVNKKLVPKPTEKKSQNVTDANSNENLYWLFSASAQTLAAFVAFLLTGFSLVITLMNNIEEKDESLSDIMHELKSNYYRKVFILSIITGIAIFLSLLSVFINKYNFKSNSIFYTITVLANIISLAGGIGVVLYIVNPNRIRKVASSLYEQISKKIEKVEEEKVEKVDAINFIQKFIELEKLLNYLLESKDVYIEKQYYKRQFFSFRNIIDILLKNEIIDKSLYDNLLELSKIRNYAVHGKIETIDKKFLKLIEYVIDKIKSITNRSS